MEPLKGCVLLAFALLQVVVLGWDRTECRVVCAGEGDEPTVLECAPTDRETNRTLTRISDENCTSRGANCSQSKGYSDLRSFNITESANPLVSNSDQRRNENKSNGTLSLASIIEVNLLGDISVLDISYFSNAKTVILNTYGFDILKVCGAKSVSYLTVSFPSMGNISFIGYFSNLKSLNLSHNNFDSLPDDEFPQSILSIDLSFNNISLCKNYSLPQSLRTLNISYNNISNAEGFILKGNVIVLDIRRNKLSRVPVIEMDNLEELYLSNNDIPVLKEKAFTGLTNLTILDLRANRLINIEERVFQGLNKLQWLDLSDNDLVSLAPATFQYLSNLVTLLLSKNVNLGNLQDFEDASLLFGTGQRLQEIEASGTNLSRIPSTVTRSVRKLLLTDNTICTIQCGEVDSFPLLQVIDVSNNMISEIEEDALGRLEFLSDLILAGNKLVNIPKSLPNQLQVLDLRCNMIKRLNNTDFLGLQKLRVLLLSNNNISVVEDGAFGQLVNLDVLDLSYNSIKTLYRSSFTGPRRLKELYLISLKDLIPLKEPLSFPAPESSHLEVISLDSSPELATRLMDDVAALTMLHELSTLSLRGCEIQTLRSDLPRYLPRLRILEISNNPLNCTDIMWLAKWLQSLNISARDSNRRDVHFSQFKSCKGVPEQTILYDENATCADSDIFAGKTITSLQEENFPTTRTEIPTTESIERSTQYLITEKITATIYKETTEYTSGQEDTSTTTEADSDPPPTLASLNQIATVTGLIEATVHKNTHSKQSKVIKSENSLNKVQNTWKYSKNKMKYTQSTSEPLIVLLNDTKHTVRVNDNQINDSISSGAFLAHEPSPSSHPGMVVFLLVVAVIVVASSVMVYSHCSQLRRTSQYHHQQDIEVSSFGGHELW